jgi:hypothetical protein
MFANRRTAKDIGLNRKDNNSMTTNNGASQLGIPDGRKIFKNDNPKFLRANIIQPIKKLRLKKKVTAMCEVTVKAYGVNPMRLENRINKNNIKKKGKNTLALLVPACSIIIDRTKV